MTRVAAGKCTLAARVDASHESTDGHIGDQFREEIQNKIEKLLEPAKVKATRALPAPLEAPKKKRGGRRVRKMKERYAVTELRKQVRKSKSNENANCRKFFSPS